MPSSDWTTMSADDYHFRKSIRGRKLKFALIPRRCHISKRIIWLENAYCLTAMYTGPGTPVYDHRWYDKDEYLIAKLRDLV